MNDTILEINHLSFAYDKERPVLKDVSFSVPKGSYVCIIGHNGSGKSTLAKCIMGLLGGYEGDIMLFGEKLSRKTLYSLRSRVGIVFQNPDNQFVGSTVADDIAFGLENRQIPQKDMQGIIESYAAEVGMTQFLNHEPQMLSGGQKQRVAIAGVLAMNPDLVIFDEATAMLDPKGKKEIASLVLKMREQNPSLTLLSITHDVEEASASDYVLVVDDGKIILSGKPEEVFVHEEELDRVHLSVPFFYALRSTLEKKGIHVPAEIKDTHTLEDYLCQ